MPLYKCKCSKTTIEVSNVTIRYVEGLGAVPDVKCAECGSYMELANPSNGTCCNFTSNKYGQL
tara:strand:- start:798 stop:986 length:189 start_codon:yes stop_codon:yes gene_type:complete